MCDCSSLSYNFNLPRCHSRSTAGELAVTITAGVIGVSPVGLTLNISKQLSRTTPLFSVASKLNCKPIGDANDLNSSSEEASASSPSSFDFLELKRELEKGESSSKVKQSDDEKGNKLVTQTSSESDSDAGSGGTGGIVSPTEPRGRRKQILRRSNFVAKQVISIESARNLGFVSQLWVNTRSWIVVLVEIRPNLLSGDFEKFLLEDVFQVGDVVLVQDENVMDNQLVMIGLETLEGYNVVTEGRKNVGRVRGYTFNINSGAVETLELDSFGISLIPSSLVSTYSLLVEDVLEVVADTVIVQEDALLRVQRITKGFWDSQNISNLGDETEDYVSYRRHRVQTYRGRSQKNIRKRFSRRATDMEDDWESPMDY